MTETLRNIVMNGDKPNGKQEDHFIITVASEIMAILCLAEDMKDLKERLSKIIVAYTAGDPVTAADLKEQELWQPSFKGCYKA